MLKSSADSLSQIWKPHKVWDSFYKGGKIHFASDEDTIFCEFDGNVKVARISDPAVVDSLIENVEEFEAISTFCVHPNNEEIVVATVKFTLRHWMLKEKRCTKNIRAHRMPILCMEYDPTGTLVATGSADKSVRVWDIAKGYCTHSFTGNGDLIRSVLFHPDGSRLLLFSTSDDSTIRCYDLKSSSCVAILKEHVALPSQLAISSDGSVLASAGRDKVVNFYDAQTCEHLKTVPIMEELESAVFLSTPEPFRAVAGLSKKSNQSLEILVTADSKGVLKVFAVMMKPCDTSSLEVQLLFHLPISKLQDTDSVPEDILQLHAIGHVFSLKDSKQLISVSKDYNISFFGLEELVQACQPKSLDKSSAAIKQLNLTPSRTIVGSYGDILDIAVLSSAYGGEKGDESTPHYRVALVTNSASVRVVNESQHCEILEGHKDIVLSVDVSPDGRWLVTSSKDHTARLWMYDDSCGRWTCRAICAGHTEAVGSVAIAQFHATYASRKVFMATGAGDKVIKRYALPLHTLSKDERGEGVVKILATHSARAHEKDINCIAIAPNDAFLASASQDKTIKIWQSEDLTPVATLKGHKRGVWKVVFSPVDKVLLSCSGDRTMKLWSMVDYSVLRTFEGHSASVLNARFVALGQQIVSCAADGLVRLHTVRTGECEYTAEDHQDRVWALAPLPQYHNVREEEERDQGEEDGKTGEKEKERMHIQYLLSGGSDGKVVLWKDVTVEEEEKRVAEREVQIVLEQELNNAIASKRYPEALRTALKLKLPTRVLQIFTTILEADRGPPNVQTPTLALTTMPSILKEEWVRRFDDYLIALSDEEVRQVVKLAIEWNTNGRYAMISQILLHSFLRNYSPAQLLEWSEFREGLPGLLAYTERHFQRISRLAEAAHFLEYVAGISAGMRNPNQVVSEEKVAIVVSTEVVQEKQADEVREEEVLKKEKKRRREEASGTSEVSAAADGVGDTVKSKRRPTVRSNTSKR